MGHPGPASAASQVALPVMDSDKIIRRLTALENSASTARVLNLLALHKKWPGESELSDKPLFRNRLLNRSIIVRHRLRPHEYQQFRSPRPTMTKVMLPIDGTDLKSGAHAFFIGQDAYDTLLEQTFGADLRRGARDRQVLDLLDQLPSLDPFLLRGHLRGHGIEPARAYFSISDADVARMSEFVRAEIQALVALSLGQLAEGDDSAVRLVDKLLSNKVDAALEPLRGTLGLSEEGYQDGVFAWRGFLYYKWVFADLAKPLRETAYEIASTLPRGFATQDTMNYLSGARERIRFRMLRIQANVRTLLNVYDGAYRSLTSDGKPQAFRNFLLSAPSMFQQLGEQLGAIQHVVSFWTFRLAKGKSRPIGYDEMADLFLDFEDSLSCAPRVAAVDEFDGVSAPAAAGGLR